MDWRKVMFDDFEPIAQLDREFTKLELQVLIEALIHYRSGGVRPNFDAVDPDTVTPENIEDIDIPVKEMTEEDEETITEMMMLFIAGFAQVISAETEMMEEAVNKGTKSLVSDISKFLKEQ
jgi:hypothetical protein